MKTPTPERTVEEIAREFEDNFFQYLKEVQVGQYDSNGKNIGFKTVKKLVDDWLQETLTAERQKQAEMVEAERDKCRKREDYLFGLATLGKSEPYIKKLIEQLQALTPPNNPQ